MIRYAVSGHTALEVRDAPIADVRRAAHLLSTGLWCLGAQEPGHPPGGKRRAGLGMNP
jgi:hypothetical protein